MTRTAIDPTTGTAVSPEEFVARHPRWRDAGIRPICGVCDEPVSPHAAHSPNMTSSFHHAEAGTCPLSSTPDPRFAHLRPTEIDLAQEARLRAQLRDPEVCKRLYARCRAICGSLSCDEFLEMCMQSHRLHVWRYKGMSLELAPFVLVTLAGLPQNPKVSRHKALAVVLRKGRSRGPANFFTDPDNCRLEVVEANTLDSLHMRPAVRLADPAVLGAATSWIGQPLAQCVHRCSLNDPARPQRAQ